jgi:hypothetical protein
VLAGSLDRPYEIHLVRFPSEEAFDRFAADDERQRFLHLKEDGVRSTLFIQGATAATPRTARSVAIPHNFRRRSASRIFLTALSTPIGEPNPERDGQ